MTESKIEQFAKDFKFITGMDLSDGYPIMTLIRIRLHHSLIDAKCSLKKKSGQEILIMQFRIYEI